MTEQRFALALAYDRLYSSRGGNAFMILATGQRLPLSEAEEAAVQRFCDSYWQTVDFDVQAYSEQGLYEGSMPRSAAESRGLSYRVNEVPEHPASKWTGERWNVWPGGA